MEEDNRELNKRLELLEQELSELRKRVDTLESQEIVNSTPRMVCIAAVGSV